MQLKSGCAIFWRQALWLFKGERHDWCMLCGSQLALWLFKGERLGSCDNLDVFLMEAFLQNVYD